MTHKNFETKIYLTQKEFDDLPEFSISVPTGNRPGRTWKRHNYVFKNKHGAVFNAGMLPELKNGLELVEDRWFHGEYIWSPPPHEGMIETRWHLIVVVEGNLEIDKDIQRFMERAA